MDGSGAGSACPQAVIGQSTEINLDRLNLGKTSWDGLYMGGQKSGYLSSTYEKRQKDGREVIVFHQSFVIQVVVMDEKKKMEISETMEYDSKSPYQLVGGSTRHRDGDDDELKIDVVVRNKTLVATIHTAGKKERTQSLEDFEYSLGEAASVELHDWSNSKIGDKITFREFDFEELTFDEKTYAVKKIKQTVAGGVPVKFYETQVTSEEMGKIGKSRISKTGESISAVQFGIFETRKESKKSATDLDYSADVVLLGSMRVNKPIGKPDSVKALELKIKKELADAIYIGPYQNVEQRDDMYVLTLGKTYGEVVPASHEEIAWNLKETENYPVNHPTIKKMVKQAIGEETDPVRKTKKLLTFVSDFIEDDYNANTFSVLEICKNKRGDCSEHSMLFATMARTAGIPCREVSGFVYMDDEVKAFGGHAWNEVVLDGHWIPVDSTWDEFEINPTHIQIKEKLELQTKAMGARMRLLKKEMK